MIGVVVGAPQAQDHPLPERRKPVVHRLADTWPGPACNQGFDPAVRLISGQMYEAERITCWACRNNVKP